jgi:hypothetical protein
MMEIIWHILLTVCAGSTCLDQDVQWFDSQAKCETMLIQYKEVPVDGDWETVTYTCKPKGSVEL